LKGWSAEDIAAAQEVVRAARGLCSVDGAFIALVWRLLAPYAETFRERFVRDGHISFDGLLVRARNLVRDHERVRGELKRRYRTILIDEFQDTDPIQYEILLYLAEQSNRSASDWRKIRLEAGKLFVVGDPKQSIYAFRRADIEAYLEVVEKIVMAQDGIECRLTTNFRSDGAILDVVNGAFDKLIQAQPGLQPPYIAIEPAPSRPCISGPMAKLSVRKILDPDGQADAETARRIEGESLARWLKQSVLGKAQILNRRGETVYAQPKDVAVLMRKLTDIHDYLEPFRRQGIRYVVEGERHFYAAKEIIDAVNLLRAVENPYDRLALVGVLRSPLGGLTDLQIYHLHRQNRLDYRDSGKLDTEFPATLVELYRALTKLHTETKTLPIGAAVDRVFSALPVELLAACHFHGEQAVANLAKLRQQAEQLGRGGLTTLKSAIRQLEKRVLDVKDEGESVLAEENLDAVRIMSIHKAKGLEFPIVILAGCQTGNEGRRSAEAESSFDWSTGLTGTRIGQTTDLAGLYITEKNRLRTTEEQKRLLYVAMTRAREHLIISCAPANRRSGGSFQAMLDTTLNDCIAGAESSTRVTLGQGTVAIDVVNQGLGAPSHAPARTKRLKKKPNWTPYVDNWARRTAIYEKAQRTTPFLTPTLLKRQEQASTEAGDRFTSQAPQPIPALMVGDLTHRFLQTWRFGGETANLDEQLRALLDDALPAEFISDRPAIETELHEILQNYLSSKPYIELTGAKILGREVPLIMPWQDQIMEGVIDLIYEKNGLLYLADYKTDRIKRSELTAGAERYRQQAEIYIKAAERSLGRQVAAFKLIFLRLGEAIEVGTESNIELTLF
jgi:ATP-dependent helicase/nuclease subunit A